MVDQQRETALPPLPARFRLSPEFRLLLASTWIAPTSWVQHQAERIEAACRDGIDWDLFLSLVARHRVLVLHDVLSRVLGSRLPELVHERLKSRKAAMCRLALRQAAELARLRSELGANGIEFIPMKGFMLSIQLYGDPGMRSTRDLDLLLKPEQMEEADRVLRRDGYERKFPDFEPTPKQKDWIHRNQVHFVYHHKQRQQLVELHWRLLQWRTEHVGEIWNRCQSANFLGTTFLNMTDEVLLLYLCDHGAKHAWSRIKWLNDVASILAQDRDISWENILALAEVLDLSLVLAQAGILVHWLYGLPLPPPLKELVMKEPRSAGLAIHAVDAMHLSEKGQFTHMASIRSVVYSTRLRKKRINTVSLRTSLLSTDEFEDLPLPDSLFRLYFPLRPLLWFYHYYIKRKP